MVGRLVVLLTTPRLPAGLLSATAWRALDTAGVVAAPSADLPLVRALIAEGREIDVIADASAVDLLALAADRTVVWVSDDHSPLSQSLAADVVRRSGQTGAAERLEPEVEILVGSFDPVGARLLDLVEVMDRLRTGCPWDRQQTHDSLVRHLLEETYETIDAIGSGDREHLREELGDLLLQVVFHARIGTEDEQEPFSIDDVAAQIVDKLVRRHPHVFGDVEVAGVEGVEASWDAIKAAEKGRTSAMDGIPKGLPALSLAAKVVVRAMRSAGSLSVPTPPETSYTEESLGEVLFALAAAAAAAGLDPEQALRRRALAEMAEVRVHEQRALPEEATDPG